MTQSDPGNERIQAYVDGRLSDEERIRFEEELAKDPDVRAEVEAVKWLSSTTREAFDREAPPDLTAKIRAALDREDSAGEAAGAPRLRSSRRGWLAAAAVLLVGVFGWWALTREDPGSSVLVELPGIVATDVHHYVEGALALDHETVDGKALEAYFSAQGIDFPTRVFDLAMMDLQLTGGIKHSLVGRDSAAFVYRGPGKLRVVCQMYRGSIEELPQATDVREHDGITFYSYEVDCVSMTFWREGDVICVLAAMAELDEVVALAFAKAMHV